MAEQTAIKCVCGGKGATEYTETDGLCTTMGTRLCACRTALPPRVGVAKWWTLKRLFSAAVDIPIGQDSVSLTVETEVPVSEENYPVVRRGNRWYPTLVDVETPRDKLMLFPDDARQLAAALLQAADAADLVDVPDQDVCGHWAPCNCRTRQPEVSR